MGQNDDYSNVIWQEKIFYGYSYEMRGATGNFVVGQHSNDDYNMDGYLNNLAERMDIAYEVDLLAAFCPTRNDYNDSRFILRHDIFRQFQEIHVILIINKWDNHAKLNPKSIEEYLGKIPQIRFHRISETDPSRVPQKVVTYINSVKP